MLRGAGGGSVGVGWYAGLRAALSARHPGLDLTIVVDCADEPGTALAALRRGLNRVRFEGPAEVARKLQAVGLVLDRDEQPPLDLAGTADAGRGLPEISGGPLALRVNSNLPTGWRGARAMILRTDGPPRRG